MAFEREAVFCGFSRIALVRLSFIVPAFNASHTIQRCLDSVYLLPLPEEEYEVIVIDDCSTDNTVPIVEGYVANHPNLKLIRQMRNCRQGAARNRGIDLASGEYIAFVDSDDSVSTEGFVHAMKAVSISGAEVCYYDFEYQAPDGEWHTYGVPGKLYETVVDGGDYLENDYTTSFNAPWRTIYKRSFLKSAGVRFVENVQWEDCDWTAKVYSRAKSIQFVSGIGYRYWFNGCSTTKQRSVRALSDRVYAGNRLMEFGAEIKERLPLFSKTVFTEGKENYVIEALRLRNLTKYPYPDVRQLQQLIGKERRDFFLAYEWPFWVRSFLRFKRLSLAFLFFACPVAKMGRTLVNRIRTESTGMGSN